MPDPKVDPITAEVVRNGLDAVSTEMKVAFQRTAVSSIIYEVLDFGGGLYDPEFRLLSHIHSLPLFQGTLDMLAKALVERVGGADTLRPGDVVLSSDGYDNGSHPQDMAIVQPVFFADELVGYVAVKAHQMDLGAKGVWATDTEDTWQEGVIFPAVKLFKAGVRDEDLWRTLIANTRLPETLAGDFSAQLNCCQIGVEGFQALIERHGRPVFDACVEAILDFGEAHTRRAFEAIPDGRYVAQGLADSDGVVDEQVPFEVAVEIAGSNITVDLTNVPDQRTGPINAPRPQTVAAVRCAVMGMIGGQQTSNDGHLRPLRVVTRPASLLHALPPAPIMVAPWFLHQVIDVILKALAQAVPEKVPAAGYDSGGTIWWGEREDGRRWADGFNPAGGQGASAVYGDGGGPLMYLGASGSRVPSFEVWEARTPTRVEHYEYAPDSGGAGRFRGGLGSDVRVRTLTDAKLSAMFERTKIGMFGLAGGREGRGNRLRIHFPDGQVIDQGKVSLLDLPAGTVVEFNMCAGGGWGEPSERDPEAVRFDIREGYVTEDAARHDYPHAFPDPGSPAP